MEATWVIDRSVKRKERQSKIEIRHVYTSDSLRAEIWWQNSAKINAKLSLLPNSVLALALHGQRAVAAKESKSSTRVSKMGRSIGIR